MLLLFNENLTAFISIIAILGLLIGSFLNVVILRLPIMMEKEWHSQCNELLEITRTDGQTDKPFNLITPNSHCPKCNHEIKAIENIPILSYLFLKGRCSDCGIKIPARYPIIEATTALLSIAVAWHFGPTWEAAAALLLTWALITLTVIDFDHQLLPDSITLPFLWLGLGISLAGVFTDPASAIIGGLVGYLSLWSVYMLFKLTTGKEGMGHGDFKLLAMLGAWLGWQAVLPIILLSSIVGAIVGISLIVVRGRDKNIPIPFGPYLATAGWITLLWGDQIIQTYLTTMNISP
ncbi:Leader peptidase (Prepilin peptidase) / N-methyltransferase [hydrothermal vent metagenome]|uniref:Leader peptidase (Prepilin peptidase) / N-methyltransferase n=1 Tax=hydrothermal vent metagenome TaxID=652676 RepID=A0A3B0ZAN6_9ZZZZ